MGPQQQTQPCLSFRDCLGARPVKRNLLLPLASRPPLLRLLSQPPLILSPSPSPSLSPSLRQLYRRCGRTPRTICSPTRTRQSSAIPNTLRSTAAWLTTTTTRPPTRAKITVSSTALRARMPGPRHGTNKGKKGPSHHRTGTSPIRIDLHTRIQELCPLAVPSDRNLVHTRHVMCVGAG